MSSSLYTSVRRFISRQAVMWLMRSACFPYVFDSWAWLVGMVRFMRMVVVFQYFSIGDLLLDTDMKRATFSAFLTYVELLRLMRMRISMGMGKSDVDVDSKEVGETFCLLRRRSGFHVVEGMSWSKIKYKVNKNLDPGIAFFFSGDCGGYRGILHCMMYHLLYEWMDG